MNRRALVTIAILAVLTTSSFAQSPHQVYVPVAATGLPGSKIAFARVAGDYAYPGIAAQLIMNADGTHLISGDYHDIAPRTLRWSPDGSMMIYISQPDSTDDAGAYGYVTTINADGSNAFAGDYGKTPDWAPNGRTFAYLRWDSENSDQIWTDDIQISHPEQLTHEISRTLLYPRWSPDGRYIAYISESNPDDGQGFNKITVIDAGTGAPVIEHTKANSSTCHFAIAPSWAKDSRHIVFGCPNVTLMDLSGQTTVIGTSYAGAVYSPDGTKIAFCEPGGFPEPPDVIVTDATGRQLTFFTYPGSGFLSWSPDSRRLVADGPSASGGPIWVMNADGTNITQIATPPSGFFYEAPQWSP